MNVTSSQQQPHQQQKQVEWRFSQSFGDDNSTDDDLVTCVKYDSSGKYIAVGDKGGRICIFEGKEGKRANRFIWDYKFFLEFTSHEAEFDALKSLEIEERINSIEWVGETPSSLLLLSSNDKTIKLWKVRKRNQRPKGNMKLDTNSERADMNHIIPPLQSLIKGKGEAFPTATCKKVFSKAHQYHVNGLSMNSDGESFISVDDLRINLWNVDYAETCFNIIDIKPPNLEELFETITSASFHPFKCNIFLYTTSTGMVRMIDMRDSALCEQHSKQFELAEDVSTRSFYSEILSSVSDAKFLGDGRHIVSRDFFTLKIWDINKEDKPVSTVLLNEHLFPHIPDLYENDCMFDCFDCAVSKDGNHVLTGSYNAAFSVFNTANKSKVYLESMCEPVSNKKSKKKKKDKKRAAGFNKVDFTRKAQKLSWHPGSNAVAVAGLNKLYLYQSFPVEKNNSK